MGWSRWAEGVGGRLWVGRRRLRAWQGAGGGGVGAGVGAERARLLEPRVVAPRRVAHLDLLEDAEHELVRLGRRALSVRARAGAMERFREPRPRGPPQ